MKSYKKITETAQTANFIDFPLILCGNGPKGTKTMQTQTLFSQIGKFGTSGTFKIVRIFIFCEDANFLKKIATEKKAFAFA